MLTDYSTLQFSVLFKSLSEEEIQSMLANCNYNIFTYNKNDILALEGDKIESIGIVLEGTVEVQKLFPSGNSVTISKLHSGEIFGEAVIFSDFHAYPATIQASSKCKVFFISRKDILSLCHENIEFLTNFMGQLSNKILMLNKKITLLSYKSIREKVAHFILTQYKIHKSNNIVLKMTKKEIAENLGIPRPSFSRELINMKEDNIIDFNKNEITIIDIDALENILL